MNRGETARTARGAPPLRQRVHAYARQESLDGAAMLMDGLSYSLRRLPPALRYLPADAITHPLAALWSSRRPIIEANFAVMLGRSRPDPYVRALARRSVHNFGRMAIDFLAARTMTGAEILSWVTPIGKEYLDGALAEGRGAILALPHFGSWDVAAAFAQASGWQLTVVTQSNWVTELAARARSAHGVTLAPRDHSLRAIFRALARNECVAILSDIAQDGLQTACVPFFGRPAPFPLGPARLAQRTGAPVLVIGCRRLTDHSYRIESLPPLRVDPHLPADDAVVALTAAIAAGFEQHIGGCPEQWYPFHPVWAE